MGLSAIISSGRRLFKNKVSSTTQISSPQSRRKSKISSHSPNCLCTNCSKERKNDCKISCCALTPLITILVMIGLVSA